MNSTLTTDFEGRKRVALALRRFTAGRMAMGDLERITCDAARDSNDRVIHDFVDVVDDISDDLYSQGLALPRREHRREYARLVIFLHRSKQVDVAELPSLLEKLRAHLAAVLGPEARRTLRSRRKEWRAAYAIWPFESLETMNSAMRAPFFLAGHGAAPPRTP